MIIIDLDYYSYLVMTNCHYDKAFRSPINTSISKYLYSFPRAKRFQNSKEPQCCRSFYQINQGIGKSGNAAFFGYGNKSSLINKEEVPPPGSYQQPGSFLGKKSHSFARSSRQSASFHSRQESLSPGPGKYHQVFDNYNHISFSMRNKYHDPLSKHKYFLGPGHYEYTPSISKTGNYFNSAFKDSGCPKIGKQQRFFKRFDNFPGPGKYRAEKTLSINGKGTYYDSRIRSTRAQSFTGVNRLPDAYAAESPGPGAYFMFSEFGALR